MNIEELVKKHSVTLEDAEFMGAKFKVKLMTEDEMDAIGKLDIDVQLCSAIFEDGKSLMESGKGDTFKSFPLKFKKDLMFELMRVNGINVEFEDLKKK